MQHHHGCVLHEWCLLPLRSSMSRTGRTAKSLCYRNFLYHVTLLATGPQTFCSFSFQCPVPTFSASCLSPSRPLTAYVPRSPSVSAPPPPTPASPPGLDIWSPPGHSPRVSHGHSPSLNLLLQWGAPGDRRGLMPLPHPHLHPSPSLDSCAFPNLILLHP